jgi:hypothetical protein
LNAADAKEEGNSIMNSKSVADDYDIATLLDSKEINVEAMKQSVQKKPIVS